MSDYTFATVIISEVDQAQAQADMGDGFFNTALSATGELPATDYMSSGPFYTEELDKISKEVTWPSRVYLGQDWQAALDSEGLVLVSEASESSAGV